MSDRQWRLIIGIPAGQQANAQNLVEQVAPGEGATTFTAGLVAAGNPNGPIVAYWASWVVTAAQVAFLKSHFQALNNANIHVFDGNEITPDELLTRFNLARPPAAAP